MDTGISKLIRLDLCSSQVYDLLRSLCEISTIAKMRSGNRSPREVLRLYNCTYSHAVLVKELIHSPKTCTLRGLFGIYYHAISTHMPPTYRMIALSSVDAENHEKLFNVIRSTARATSSRKSGENKGRDPIENL